MRMPGLIGAIAALAALQIAPPAHASFYTGNELYQKCMTEKSDGVYFQNNAFCMAYIIGSIDMMESIQQAMGAPECTSSGMTVGQMRDIVLKYIVNHPEKRQLSANVLVFSAMNEAFGCTFKKVE